MISTENIEDILTLTPMQQGMLYHHLLAPGSGTYLEQSAWTLTGAINVEAFRCAWQQVLDRHMALRAGFLWEGLEEPLQVIYRDVEVPFYYEDWSGSDDGDATETRLDTFLLADRQKDFDLAHAPLMRLALIHLSSDRLVFVWTHHHLLIDGWSQPVLFGDFLQIYQGLITNLPISLPPAVPYSRYIAWLHTQNKDQAEQAWRAELSGFTEPNPLDWGHPEGGSGQEDYRVEKMPLPIDLSRSLNAFARRQGLTLNAIFQGAWGILLSRCTRQEDVVFGATVSGRPPSLTDADGIVGLLINTLPVRLRVDPAATALNRLHSLQAHQASLREFDYTALMEIQTLSEIPQGTPLFKSLLVYENYPTGPMDGQEGNLSSFAIQPNESFSRTNYPLTFAISPGEPIRWMIAYETARFAPSDIQRIFTHLQVLLEGLMRDPEAPIGKLPLLTAAEKRLLLEEWGQNPHPVDLSKTVLDLFAEQARLRPLDVALRYAERSLTYQELDCRSNQLARALITSQHSNGTHPVNIIGICLPPGLEMIIAMLGIQKAGAAYLPLDPTYAADRLAYMAADSGMSLLLTQSRLRDRVSFPPENTLFLEDDQASGSWPAILKQEDSCISKTEVSPNQPAYIIYTSGSTGRPKGTRLLHRGLSNLVQSSRVTMDVHPGDRLLQFFSISFDPSVKEIFTALTSGATLVLAPREQLTSPVDLQRLVSAYHITHFSCTPLYLALLDPGEFPTLRTVISGGEALPVEVARRWCSQAKLTFINEYGPTETTVAATYFPVRRVAANTLRISIGRPFPNIRVYILDGQQNLAPQGIPGELYIGGAGVGAGYINRPEQEAVRFIPDPFYPGERLYRTGDLACWLADGSLDFLGRLDDQVKIRGFRVEPGEIEAVLREHACVRLAAVMANQEDETSEKSLAAYVVPVDPAIPPDVKELATHLRHFLPEYMIPARFIFMAELPLTSNGKIDRRRLPKPDKDSAERALKTAGFRAPYTLVQQGLADLWKQVLHVNAVSLDDHFFTLGGHSLRAAQLVSRIREVFQVEFPLRDLFVYPTLAAMSTRVEMLLTETQATSVEPILPAPAGVENIPLSFAQQRLWFLDQLAPGSLFYNLPIVMRLQGQLDPAALQRSLNAIVHRHAALRTRFIERDGKPVQDILPELSISIPLIDFTGLPEDRRIAEAERTAGEEARQPFNLSTGPLLRALLIRLAPADHIALLVMHHIISDGWSLGVLLRELQIAYTAEIRGETLSLADLPVQYSDYAIWQRRWLQGPRLEEQMAYWKEQLANLPPLIELPTDHPRPVMQSPRGGVVSFELSKDLAAQLNELCQAEGVTLFMALLAAFQLLLARYSGQADIPVGTAVANRGRSEIEGLIGFFVNTLVLRTRLEENFTFHDLLQQVRETCLGAYVHQDLPFETLVEALRPERNLSHTPLFQAMFVIEPLPEEELQLPGLILQTLQLHTGTATFDMTMQISTSASGLFASLEYNSDLWERDTITRMAENFTTLLASITADPEQPVWTLPILSGEERHRLLVEWNRTEAPAPLDTSVHQLFIQRAHQAPDAQALIFCDLQHTEILTYHEVDTRTNQLARYLQKRGVGLETIVAISTERSLESIIAILGVLKAGGAYLPLDPNYPPDRLDFMLSDSHAPVLLTQSHLVERLPVSSSDRPGLTRICLDADWPAIAQEPADDLPCPVAPANLAYVIYTSGSTGKPKGALLEHRGLCNLAEAQRQAFRVDGQSRVLQFSPFSFDASVWEFAMALANGAALVLTPQSVLASTPDLSRLLQTMRITHITLPPSVLQVLPQETLPDLRVVVAAGEACPAELVAQWAPGRNFFNAYGPTETTVCASMHLCDPGETGLPPIGRPLSNVRLYVCDPRQQMVPVGVPGELLVGGVNLARGYLDRPELTAEKFIPNPFGEIGDRLYRTGDLVRYLPNGEIEFLGRIDQQVKIRGFRVELGEIEEALRRHPSVHQAVVIARSIRRESRLNDQLVAYIVSENAHDLTPTVLQDFLRQSLPEYMLPAIFILLEALPINPSGKIDRKALANDPNLDPELFLKSAAREYVAPSTETETRLAQICAELLNLDRVGVTDNFFDLGGHSLLATQFISRIRETLQVEIPLRNLFEHPNIREIAQEIEGIVQTAGVKADSGAETYAGQPITRVSREQYRRKRSDLS